ncbi:MAG: YciI family protein [Balneolaceae bacterium]|nr:YciI family protein [Balneolaceae bacterium]
MHYLLIYELSTDYLERRGEFRDEHLKMAWDAHEKGDLILGGALQEPADCAFLLFEGDSPKAAENFAKSDPYVKNGLIENWRVRPWMTVVGEMAASPVKPE